jgi:hypothetical protein
MPTKRSRAKRPAAPVPAGAITAAYELEKSRFLARNAERCPYLLIQLQPEIAERRLAIIASYAFSDARDWHQVETHVQLAALQVEAGPEPSLVEAFARLDDGIGAARIARLFAPRSTDERVAVSGRH